MEISGGSFIFTGYTTTFSPNGDIWIVKLNSSGNIIWQKIYGTSNYDEGDSIIVTSDNYYVILGLTSDNLGYYDLWLLKLDTNGNVVWQYTYGGSDDDGPAVVRQTSDGGFIIAAYTYSFGQGNSDTWILKLDSTGNIIWQKTYGSANEEWPEWIEQTSDGGYIVAGAKDISGLADYYAWIMKLDSSGGISWERLYGPAQDGAYSIQQTSDGGYIVGCSTSSYGAGLVDIWVLKLDSSGNTQWQKTYGDTASDQVAMVKSVSSGGYIIGGRTFSWGATGLNFLGIKVDQNGNMTPACNFAASTNVSPIISNSIVADTNVSPNSSLNYSISDTTSSPSNTNSTAPNLCNLCSEPIFDGVQSAFDVDGCNLTGIQITWQQPTDWGDGATGGTYDVRRYTTNGCTGSYVTLITALPETTTSYTDTTAAQGVTYYYQVVAINNCSSPQSSTGTNSCSSAVADNIGSNPSGLSNNTAADIDVCVDSGVIITWPADPAAWGDNATGTRTYDILREGSPIATGISYGSTSFTDSTGVNGTSYTYTVKYNNGCGLSSVTNPGAVAADYFAYTPLVSNNNTASDVDACNDTGTQICWDVNPADWGDNGFGTRTYNVLRNSIAIASSISYGTTCYTDMTGTNNVSYNYSVQYVNGCNLLSETSGAAAGDFFDNVPCPSVGNTLIVSKSGTDAALNWTAISCLDFANYRVFGSSSYDAPFPSAWTILGNPIVNNFSDVLNSAYIAYKILSVDQCNNISSD